MRARVFDAQDKQMGLHNDGVKYDHNAIEGLLRGRGVNIPQPGNMPGQQPIGGPGRQADGSYRPANPQDLARMNQESAARSGLQQAINAGGGGGGMAQPKSYSPAWLNDLNEANKVKALQQGQAQNEYKKALGAYYIASNNGAPAAEVAALKAKANSIMSGMFDANIAAGGLFEQAVYKGRPSDGGKWEFPEMNFAAMINAGRFGSASAQGAYGGGMGITQNQWGGGNMTANSPPYSPQASFVVADNARRGLGGTTAGQNQVVLSNSLALADKSMQDQRLQMDAQQQQYAQGADQQRFQESQNQFALQRGDNLTRDAINYYKERNSIPPDMSPLLQMAQMEGQGATDGMQQPQSGGWGGGGWMSGYNVPQGAWGAMGAYYQPQQQPQGQQMSAQEQLASVQDQQRTAAANRDLQMTLMGQEQAQINAMTGTAQARARAQRQHNQKWGL
jgi:hypothetical protein